MPSRGHGSTNNDLVFPSTAWPLLSSAALCFYLGLIAMQGTVIHIISLYSISSGRFIIVTCSIKRCIILSVVVMPQRQRCPAHGAFPCLQAVGQSIQGSLWRGQGCASQCSACAAFLHVLPLRAACQFPMTMARVAGGSKGKAASCGSAGRQARVSGSCFPKWRSNHSFDLLF